MNNRAKGDEQEQRACQFLTQKGYDILEKNYRCRQGELDIVAKEKDTLVIAEVKYRFDKACGDPAEAVDVRKQRKICRVTLDYLMRHPCYQEKPCRFDVIAVYGDGTIRHVKDAFDYQG